MIASHYIRLHKNFHRKIRLTLLTCGIWREIYFTVEACSVRNIHLPFKYIRGYSAHWTRSLLDSKELCEIKEKPLNLTIQIISWCKWIYTQIDGNHKRRKKEKRSFQKESLYYCTFSIYVILRALLISWIRLIFKSNLVCVLHRLDAL